MKRWIVVLVGPLVTMSIAIGCGGSTSDTAPGPKTGPLDAGPATPPPTDSGTGGDTGKPDNFVPQDAGADTSIDAPLVTIDYMASCPELVPCASDPTGTWKLSGGCVDGTVFDQAKQNCAGLTESNVVIKGRGISTFDGVNVTQKSESTFTATLFVPNSCTMGAGCALIGTFLMTAQGGGFDSATCTATAMGPAGCNCDIAKSAATSTTDTYTATGGLLTSGSGAKFDYCITAGTTFKSRQQNTNGTPGPATFTATK